MSIGTTRMPVAAIAPTEEQRRLVHQREHALCYACGRDVTGGLGLRFQVEIDGSVTTDWSCPPSSRSYAGILHGGLIATLLDSAMVHALFARGVVARTAELRIRYHHPVGTDAPVQVTARLTARCGPLYCLEAAVSQNGVDCATAQAKFMANGHENAP